MEMQRDAWCAVLAASRQASAISGFARWRVTGRGRSGITSSGTVVFAHIGAARRHRVLLRIDA